MSNDNDSEKTGYLCLTVALIAFFVTIGSCTANRQNRIAEAIAAGADPLKVACAYNNGGPNVCAIVAAKQ